MARIRMMRSAHIRRCCHVRTIHLPRMPTPSEQKALAFVAIVVLLGGAVRVLRANSSPDPTVAEQQAVAAQARAVDVASSSDKASRTARRARPQRPPARDTLPVVLQSDTTRAP